MSTRPNRSARVAGLLFCAKHLFVAAILAGPPASHPIFQGTGHHRADGPRQARTMLGCQDDDDLHRHPGAAARGPRRHCRAAAGAETGVCPSGYASGGSYCTPTSDRAPRAIPKVGVCPGNWSSTGAYCVEPQRPR
jgi:hypothetical protein